MTKEELCDILSERFYEGFAEQMALIVVENNAVEYLYQLANTCSRPKEQSEKIIFRAAYTLETIFFKHRQLFVPLTDRFCNDFPSCTNSSARRHFAKIMTHLITTHKPTDHQCQAIATGCAEWSVDHRVRVAVKIWAIETLIALKDRVEWITAILPDILEPMRQNQSPAITKRMKRWKKITKP